MRHLILCLLILSSYKLSLAAEWYHEPSISVSAASRLHGQDTLTSQRNAFRLKSEYTGEQLALNWDGRLEYDAVYDYHNAYGKKVRDEYQHQLWVDDAYLRWSTQHADLSLGYQKIVWGQADDIRVVDVINPLDLKDFVLFDIDEYRISLPILRLETHINDWAVDASIILDTQANELPPTGSEFDLGFPGMIPHHQSSGEEFALRLQNFINDSDVAFYLFQGYNDMPVLSFDQNGASFDYHRELMLGSSISRPIDDFVLRAEYAYFYEREFSLNDGTTTHDNQSQWLLGVDLLQGNWMHTAQYTDSHIHQHNNNFSDNKTDPLYTLSTEGQFASDTIRLRFAISHADRGGGSQLYQSKLSYQPNAHWRWQFNIDLLDGASTSLFGQFRNNDRIWTAVTYTF